MTKILKTNLQVSFVNGSERTTKTFSNVVDVFDEERARQFGQIIASLAPVGATLEQVKAIVTKQF